MSSDLATREVFAHQLHQSTTLEWAKCTHDIKEDLTHPATLEDFALACTFYTTFNPSFHTSEPVDDDGLLPPILDTGATHCLLPSIGTIFSQAPCRWEKRWICPLHSCDPCWFPNFAVLAAIGLPELILSIICSNHGQFFLLGVPSGQTNRPHQTCVFLLFPPIMENVQRWCKKFKP